MIGISSCGPSPTKHDDAIKIVSSNNQTFLVNEDTQTVFVYRDNEFVQTPIIALSDFVGKKADKYFFKSVPNFTVAIALKYRSGQMSYQVSAMPEKDGDHYKLSDWLEYLKMPDNMLTVNLHDSEGFTVQAISLPFGGLYAAPRTTIVDGQGKPASVEFDGSIPISVSTFELVQDADVTYVLQRPTSVSP